MTISTKISNALASALDAGGIDSTIQGAFEESETDAYTTRVVCQPGGVNERQTLRGVYDVDGSVHCFTSVDTENAIATHLRLCDSVRDFIGGMETCPQQIMAQDSSIHIYNRSWHITGMDDDAGDRGFKSTFNYRAVARDTVNNP